MRRSQDRGHYNVHTTHLYSNVFRFKRRHRDPAGGEICEVCCSSLSLRRGQRSLECSHRVEAQERDKIRCRDGRSRNAIHSAGADGVAAQSGKPLRQWNVRLAIVPIECSRISRSAILHKDIGHRRQFYPPRCTASGCGNRTGRAKDKGVGWTDYSGWGTRPRPLHEPDRPPGCTP